MQTTKFAFLALLLKTGASFDVPQRRRPKRTMALQVTRVEQAMGNGLRRLYRLPKLTTAPSKATGVMGSFRILCLLLQQSAGIHVLKIRVESYKEL